MSSINAQPVELLLQDTVSRVDIIVVDVNGDPVAATALHLRILDAAGDVILEDDFFSPPSPGGLIVNPSTGNYYYPFGDDAVQTLNSTEDAGDYLFHWNVTAASGTEPVSIVQVARVVTAQTLSWLPSLRLQLDKAAKYINEDPEDPTYLGYTDSMLIEFLQGGLSLINAFQPYPVWASLDAFPVLHKQLLIDAALFVGLTSQQLYAVDTDLQFCFPEGTPVVLADGRQVSVNDVKVGDMVVDRTGAQQTVEAAWCEGAPDELTELTLWGGKVFRSTKNHEWPVWAWMRNCYCGCGTPVDPGKAFALGHHRRVKDYELVHIRGGTCNKSKQSIIKGYDPIKRLEAQEIRPGDFLLMPRKFSVLETDVTEDEARLIGYYVAEGHPYHRNNTKENEFANLTFTLGEHERETLAADIQRIAATHGVETVITKDASADAIYVGTRNDYRRSKGAARLCSVVERHVLGDSSLTKHLSPDVMRWSLELKRQLIIGMMRGDGHQSWMISKDPNGGKSFGAWYNTSSPTLMNQTQLILAQLGYPTRLCIDEGGEVVIRGIGTTSQACYKLCVPPPFAFEVADLVWGDASEANKFPRHGRKGWSPIRPACMVDEDFVYLPVKSAGTVPNDLNVFNLTVSGDHSYLVDNIATFNSDQGNSFQIGHYAQLSQFANTLWQRLSTLVPLMKRQYLANGAIHMQIGPGARFLQTIQSAPWGTAFRAFFNGFGP